MDFGKNLFEFDAKTSMWRYEKLAEFHEMAIYLTGSVIDQSKQKHLTVDSQ